MIRILLKNGNLVDPLQNKILKKDILIEDGNVSKIASSIRLGRKCPEHNCQVIDCQGLLIVPGLIDMHVHFRTPGQEHKETLATGSMAALAGGFTTVLAMANTVPVPDDPNKLFNLLIRNENEGLVRILQASPLTKGLQGKESIIIMPRGNKIGVPAASDDGRAPQDPKILMSAMRSCKEWGLPILLHCEDYRFPPNDKWSEILYISLVLKLAQEQDASIHIQHVSCQESVKLIKRAKVLGVKVTCETAPHYMALTQKDFKRIGADAMMNPPLRGEADRQAIIQGLFDATIDVIATDHAPHTDEEKEGHHPPFGIIGLETAVPVVLSVLKRHLSLPEIFAKMTINPARILRLKQKGLIRKGWPADITIIDLKKRKVLEAQDLKSKSHNSPWLGKRLQTWPVMTIRNGKILMKDGKITI